MGHINNKKELIIKFFVFIIVFTSLCFVISCNIRKVKVLVISDVTSNEKLEFYLPNNNFSLGYTHSVMKTPVEEYFYINEYNQIVLEKTIYKSYGVGLPFLSEEGELEIVNGDFILKLNRVFNELNMVISPIPKHWLTIGEKKYEFNNILEVPNSTIKIYITQKYKLKSFLNKISLESIIFIN